MNAGVRTRASHSGWYWFIQGGGGEATEAWSAAVTALQGRGA